MPLYEYQCAACAHRFERIQKFSDPPAESCPACGGKVEKLLSSPAIQFKGSGWYITDYARKPADSAASAKPSDEKKDGKQDEKKTDTGSSGDTSSPAPAASTAAAKDS